MKRLIAASLLFLLALIPLSAAAPTVWGSVGDKVKQAVVFIEISAQDGSKTGSCSGFMIDSKKHQVLTAGHCDGDKITVDGTPALKLFRDERKDLMVLRAYAVDRPALSLSDRVVSLGDEVASIGFGFGLEQPMFRVTHVSVVKLEIQDLSGPFMMFDTAFIPGQSGGPVVDTDGKIIAIVQRGSEGLGIGVGADVIKDKVGRYFGEDK